MNLLKGFILRILVLLLLVTGSYLLLNKTALAADLVPVTTTPCVFNNPSVQIILEDGTVQPPDLTKNGVVGQERDFQIKVTNKNSGTACTPTAFTLATTNVHPNFTVNPQPVQTPAIGNGASTIIHYRVTPTCGVAKGLHTLNVSVANKDKPNKVGLVTPRYNVTDNTCVTTAPTTTPRPSLSPAPPAACVRKAPTIVFIAPANKNGSPGELKTFEVKVTNTDTGRCPATDTFVLSKENHPNWTGTFDENPMVINANNGSKNTHFKLTPPKDSEAGPKQITVGVRRQSSTAIQATAIVTYNVISTTPTPGACIVKDPTISVDPLTRTDQRGATVTYAITIHNNNVGKGCVNRTGLTLTKDIPGGDNTLWVGNFSKRDGFDIPAGGTATSTLTVKSPTSAVVGPRKITVNLKNSAGVVKDHKDLTYVIAGVPAGCTIKEPTISVNPLTRTGPVKSTVTYAVTVNNNDLGKCANRSLTLIKDVPGGDDTLWVGNFSKRQFDMIPGSTGTSVLSVTSPATAVPGARKVVVSLKNANGVVKDHKDLTYVVAGIACTIKEPTVSVVPLSRTDFSGATVTYAVTLHNNDQGGCAARSLTLTKDLPGGVSTAWVGNYSKREFTIPAAGTDSSTLTVTSPKGLNLGPRTITVNLKNANGVVKDSKTLTYVISGTGPTPTPGNCVKNTPQLTVTTDKLSTTPGGFILYKLTVKNMDQGNGCQARALSFTNTTPNTNWNSVYAPGANITVPLGGTTVLTLKITSPADASAEKKVIHLSAANNNGIVQLTKDLNFTISGSPTPTPTPICIDCVRPTPTPTPGAAGSLNLAVGTDGVGVTPRVPLGGNTSPKNTNRNLTISLYKAGQTTTAEKWLDWSLAFNPASGRFEAFLPLSNAFQTGTYNLYVQGPRFLTAQFPNSLTLTRGQVNSPAPIYLITGNINNVDQSANKLDILDYNALISCSIYSQSAAACNADPSYKINSDLNDDGIINEDDLTLYVLEVANQQGVSLPGQ